MPAAGAPKMGVGHSGVNAAEGADAVVAMPDLLAQVSRVGAKAPFVDTPLGAKCVSPARNFQTAPAAKRAIIDAALEFVAFGKAAGHGARGAHKGRNNFTIDCFGGSMGRGSAGGGGQGATRRVIKWGQAWGPCIRVLN